MRIGNLSHCNFIIIRLLNRKDYEIGEETYGPIINLYDDNAYNFLIKIYEFLTKNKVPEVFS